MAHMIIVDCQSFQNHFDTMLLPAGFRVLLIFYLFLQYLL